MAKGTGAPVFSGHLGAIFSATSVVLSGHSGGRHRHGAGGELFFMWMVLQWYQRGLGSLLASGDPVVWVSLQRGALLWLEPDGREDENFRGI